jgi:uncharacterized membrane protein
VAGLADQAQRPLWYRHAAPGQRLAGLHHRLGQAGSRLPGPSGRRGPVPDVNRDDDRFCKGGLICVNPDDPAIMVGNRFGVG